MAQYTFIVNPCAGGGHALEVEQKLKEAVDSLNLSADFLHSEQVGHAKQLTQEAAAAGSETVISVSGDGTNHEVAEGVIGTSAAMGVIPAGTGNDLIKTMGIPKDPVKALRHLLDHPPRKMDVGRVNDRLFMNVCGTGFDVSVLDQAERYKQRMRGLMPYLMGLISAIRGNEPIQVQLSVDGGAFHDEKVLILSVANGRYIGGGIPICPAADMSDGMLDLVQVEAVDRRLIPRYLPGLMRAKILDFKITKHQLCRRVCIRSKGMRIQLDGEIVSMDEADFEILPGALRARW